MDDKKQFEKKYKENKGFITSVLRRYVRNPETVEDLLQQTFMKAWIARDSFENRASYRTWLYKIAVNLTFNFLKSEKHKIKILNSNPELFENINTSPHYMYASPLDISCELESMEQIRQAIFALPEDMQKALIMFAFYGIPYKEIANTLGIPIGTVRSRIKRARERLSIVDKS